jgi:hypothetical protein
MIRISKILVKCQKNTKKTLRKSKNRVSGCHVRTGSGRKP